MLDISKLAMICDRYFIDERKASVIITTTALMFSHGREKIIDKFKSIEKLLRKKMLKI